MRIRKTRFPLIEAAYVKLAVCQYDYSHLQVAQHFEIAPARVSEIATGKKWSFVVPARYLPADFPPRDPGALPLIRQSDRRPSKMAITLTTSPSIR